VTLHVNHANNVEIEESRNGIPVACRGGKLCISRGNARKSTLQNDRRPLPRARVRARTRLRRGIARAISRSLVAPLDGSVSIDRSAARGRSFSGIVIVASVVDSVYV